MSFFFFILVFPLVFLPDAGISVPTAYGLLAPSDFVLPILYLFLLPNLLYRSSQPIFHRNVTIFYVLFAFIAALTTLLIPTRYPQMALSGDKVLFGFLKLAKFLEYSFFGYLLARSLNTPRRIRFFELSFAAGCLLLACSIFYNYSIGYEDSYFYLDNGIALTLAGLIIFWIGSSLRKSSRPIMYLKLALVVILLLAMFIEQGRGGWIAAMVGIGYLVILRRPNLRKFIIAAIILISIAYAYNVLVPFKDEVIKTFPRIFNSDSGDDFADKYGIDDGGRIGIWGLYFKKISLEPILGAGFFNRTPESGLDWWGSHNFFLQMALETGLLGLFCLLAVFYYLWVDTTARSRDPTQLQTYRAVLIAVVVGCQSGEYLYGGSVLLMLSIITAYHFAFCNQKKFLWVGASAESLHDYPDEVLLEKQPIKHGSLSF